MNKPSFQSLLHNPVQFLAFGFGSGLAPRAPGTFGTLAAIPLYLLLVQGPWLFFAAFVLVATLAGIYWCDRAARELGVHDHPGIVWDEIAGFLITMLLAPPGWPWLLAGFVLFRLLDIWKPWPIRLADRKVGGGFGIMLDDVLAGIGAGALLLAADYLLTHL
jgi:phosphatidylglycerophosphatase A